MNGSSAGKLKVTLLTGRTIDQGRSKEGGKISPFYQESVAACFMDSEDMAVLGVKENQNVRVSTKFGSVVLRVIENDRGFHSGVIFVPYGLWINIIIDPETHGIGMPSFKGIPAEVEPAIGERILTIKELLKEHFGK